MNILFVTDNRFWRNQLGSHRRITSLVEHLAENHHSITVLFVGYLYPPDVAALSSQTIAYELVARGERPQSASAKFQAIGTPRLRNLANAAKAHVRQLILEGKRRIATGAIPSRRFRLQTRELKLQDYENPATLAQFQSVCASFQPDVVIIEYVRLAWLLRDGADALKPQCLRLIDTHDVQHERQTRFHLNNEVHDIDITPAEEASALGYADVLLAIQHTDAQKLRTLSPTSKIIVAGYPSVLRRHSPRCGSQVNIGFFGSSMLPNKRAAENLIHEVMPSLRRRFGELVELHLFGGVCNVINQSALPPGIHAHGFVDDLDAAYEQIDIIANPVDFGGGLKIKNVEALCHGKPLVTTPIGAEGLEDGAETAYLIAEGDTDFIARLCALIENPEQREALALAARTFAEASFSKNAVYHGLDSYLTAYQQNKGTL